MTLLADALEKRYERVILVLTPALILSQYALYLFMRAYWKPSFSKDALAHHKVKAMDELSEHTWRGILREVCASTWAFHFHAVFATSAMYRAWDMVGTSATQGFGDYERLLVAGDANALNLQDFGGLMGSVFASLMVQYIFYFALRWETEMLQLFHHVAFISVTVVLARRCAMPFVGLFAMAMEISSLPLAVMTVFRQLDGELCHKINGVASLSFAILFMLSRVGLFGYALLLTLRWRLVESTALPVHVPLWEVDAVLVLLLAGLLLQLHWARLIVLKIRRLLAKSKQA